MIANAVRRAIVQFPTSACGEDINNNNNGTGEYQTMSDN